MQLNLLFGVHYLEGLKLKFWDLRFLVQPTYYINTKCCRDYVAIELNSDEGSPTRALTAWLNFLEVRMLGLFLKVFSFNGRILMHLSFKFSFVFLRTALGHRVEIFIEQFVVTSCK